jgi:hypothetical protein
LDLDDYNKEEVEEGLLPHHFDGGNWMVLLGLAECIIKMTTFLKNPKEMGWLFVRFQN